MTGISSPVLINFIHPSCFAQIPLPFDKTISTNHSLTLIKIQYSELIFIFNLEVLAMRPVPPDVLNYQSD